MPAVLPVQEFLERARHLPVVDVRSPSEFAQGHIPDAVNLPLFSDAERAEIGTIYVRQGREPAVLRGLGMVGLRMEELARSLLEIAAEGELLMHCWRGGMRSGSVAWLAEQAGCRVRVLEGGYKRFRRWVVTGDFAPHSVRVLGGLTGAGKTEVLHELAACGQSMIDLEGLAHHKGSAFGALGELPQPTQEQFENELALAWLRLPEGTSVWLEDESRRVGRCHLPDWLWQAKLAGDYAVLELPDSERIRHLERHYGQHDADELRSCLHAIRKRLGGLRTTQAEAALDAGDLKEVCRIVLAYYDKAYRFTLDDLAPTRKRVFSFETLDPPAIAAVLADALSS